MSTKEQAQQGYSIANQKEKNTMYMNLFDYEVEKVTFYIDDGISASTLKRKELQRMISDVRENKIDEIIIYKLDRLTRSVQDVYQLIQLFLSYDVNLVAVMGAIDIKSANGRLLVGILAIFAQWERETICERTNDGQLQMTLEGKYPKGGCPYGYIKDEEKRLVIDDSRKQAVIDIFTLASAGKTYAYISAYIEKEYNDKLSVIKIKNIINESGYYGCFIYKERIFYNVFPAIVTEKIVEKARMTVKCNEYSAEQEKFYFRQKVHCKKCNKLTYGVPTYKKEKRYYYYYCKSCKKRMNQDLLISNVLNDVLQKYQSDKTLENLELVKKNIKKIENKLNVINKQFFEDKIDEQQYLKSVQEGTKRLNKEKSKLVDVELFKNKRWKEMTDAERHHIIDQSVCYIVVDLDSKIIDSIEYLKK